MTGCTQRNHLQAVGGKTCRQLKDGAETEGGVGVRTNAGVRVAGRCESTMHTDRLRVLPGILPPGFHSVPVFDISAVLVQYPVPFVALGRAALGLARTCRVTSHRRCAQGIVHAAAGIIFAENQTCGIQVIPAYRMRYGIVRHKQAVGVFVLPCILLGGRHLRHELVGVHRSHIGKRHIMQRAVRQIAVCRPGNVHRRQVKIVSAAGGEGKLLVRLIFHRQRAVDPVERIPLIPAGLEGGSGNNSVGSGGIACRFRRDLLVVRVKQPIGKGVVQHRIPVVLASFAVQQSGTGHEVCWQRVALSDACTACRHSEGARTDITAGGNRTAIFRRCHCGIGKIQKVDPSYACACLDGSNLDGVDGLPRFAGDVGGLLVNFKDIGILYQRGPDAVFTEVIHPARVSIGISVDPVFELDRPLKARIEILAHGQRGGNGRIVIAGDGDGIGL